ncbi:MAG: type II toxin-antitoxin system RelE/ParE family toxin [Proteobacteria bacterium]|nr:type II toxin-antitoxin system RelE/ParE family toxin [Pseudomonadota bacterium]
MRLEWSFAAISELNEIRLYIRERDPAAAERVKDRIVLAMELIGRRPYTGRSGRLPDTREFVFTDIPYVGIYDVDEKRGQVTVLHVIHTARNYPPDT